MSHFSTIALEIKNCTHLVEALVDMGWKIDQIEVHSVPTNLYGYQGDVRKDVANVIIRRKYVGGLSNDIGFVKQPDGTYTAIISDYDRGWKYGDRWLNSLKQKYGVRVAEHQAKIKGMSVKKTTKQDGTVQLVLRRA